MNDLNKESSTQFERINKEKESYIKNLQAQIKQKDVDISSLMAEKENLEKLFNDALAQVAGPQHMIEAKHRIWDQIIEKISKFRMHLELFQH